MGISKDGLGRHRIEGVGDYLYKYKHVTRVDADVEATFEWFEHEGAFRRLMPPWEVAEEVIFLGGPGGLFINGATLILDGGGQHWGEVWTTGKPDYYRQASRKWDED